MKGGGPSGKSGSREIVDEGEETCDESMPHEPSLWNNPTFNVMEFSDHHSSFSENFLGDY